MQINLQDLFSDIQAIKQRSPLIHNITNYVVMEHTANSLLAVGASPIMAHAVEEVEDIVKIAHSLVLNIGTLSAAWTQGMALALKAANAKGIPVVFDPVGVGATPYRTREAHAILDAGAVTVIRANASEIVSLSGHTTASRGVDSLLHAADYPTQAKQLALQKKCVVWMSGPTDIMTDGRTLIAVHNGHALMGKVTGMGCSATAITGAFLAVNSTPLLAAAHAAIFMGVVGELAAQKSASPGSFKLAFIDALFNISSQEIVEKVRYEISS